MKDITYLVTISDRKMIPGVGKGPIKKPIRITKKKFELLKTLGFHIEFASDAIVLNKKEDMVEPIVEKEMKEVITPEAEVEEPEEVITEEIDSDEAFESDASDELDYSEDEETEEESYEVEETTETEVTEDDTLEDDEDIIEETEIEEDEEIYDIEALTKEQLKDKLKELGVNFPNNAGINKLRDILAKNMD